MNSAAMSRPAEGVPRPWRASEARKETSAFRLFGVRRRAICCAAGDNWAWTDAARRARRSMRCIWLHDNPTSGCLLQIDCPAAGFGAAAARHGPDVLRETVVHRQFFTEPDRPLAHIEDVSSEGPGAQVGLATVIDDFGAGTAEGAVQGPVVVEREQVGDVARAALLGFAAADFFTRILDDFAAGRDALPGVDPAPVDPRSTDGEFEAGVAG